MANLGRRLFGAALAGAGQGIVAQAAQRREDALLAQRRKWQVEDRNLARTWDIEDRDYREDRADKRTAANQPLVPIVGDEGSPIYSTRSDAVGNAVPTKPSNRAPGRPVEVVGPDGRTILVPPEQAYGMSPPPKDKGDGKLYVLSEDPMTGARTYGTREDALAAGKVQEGGGTGADDQAVMDRAAEARKRLGPEWTDTDYWNPAVSSKEWLGVGDEEFDQRLAERIRQNPGVPDDELARQLAAELTGNSGGSDGDGAAAASGPPAGHPNAQQAPDGYWYVPAGDGKWKRVQ